MSLTLTEKEQNIIEELLSSFNLNMVSEMFQSSHKLKVEMDREKNLKKTPKKSSRRNATDQYRVKSGQPQICVFNTFKFSL